MPIQDGTIDEIVNGVVARLGGGQQVSQQQRSEAEALAAELTNRGYDKDWVESSVLTTMASERIADRKTAAAEGRVAAYMTNRRAIDIVNDTLAGHAREDERVKINRAAILDMVDKKWKSDQAMQAAFNRGDIDRVAYEELVDSSVDEWFQTMKLEKGPSKTQTPSGTTAKAGEAADGSAIAKEGTGPMSRDDLDDNQMEAMLATKSNIQRFHPKGNTFSDAELERMAIERTKDLPRPEKFFSGSGAKRTA